MAKRGAVTGLTEVKAPIGIPEFATWNPRGEEIRAHTCSAPLYNGWAFVQVHT